MSSQSIDYVGWANCIQEPESRKSQVEWHKSSELYFHQMENR